MTSKTGARELGNDNLAMLEAKFFEQFNTIQWKWILKFEASP